MFTVGLTGGIGSGKSTVCRVFAVLGIPAFNADEQAKVLMAQEGSVREQLIEAFGPEVWADGRLDTKALAARVFHDEAALKRLNAIVHPAVRTAFAQWAARQEAPYVINEAAILVETGAYKQFNHLVVVVANKEERIRRVMRRDGVDRKAVLARMANQAADGERERVAHSIIRNEPGHLVIPQVLALHRKLLLEARG